VSPIFPAWTQNEPSFPGQAGFFSVQPLLGGDAGVEQTVAVMRQLVDEALRDSSIIRLAADIVRGVPAFDDYAEANALYAWVKQHIRFTKDPVNKEKLYPPSELLKIRAGDCDDISMLLSTLLMAVGYPARLMTVATPGAPDQFSHVYVEAEIPPGSGNWIAVDPARADSQFGVAPPITTRARWWSLVYDTYGDLSGMRRRSSALSGLGHYPRFRSHVSGMGAYASVRRRTMGDTTQPSGSSTSSTIATIEQGTADIIRASEGIPASPFAYQSGPWSSFATPFTPGANMPPAGYTYNAAGQLVPTASLSVSGSSNWVLWFAIGLGALLLVGGRK
jgi:hypothetical protein